MKFIIHIVCVLFPFCLSAQVENQSQPDSIYFKYNVKRIFVYENSEKDLSKIIQYDKSGKILNIQEFSASYNRKTRNFKSLNIIKDYKYDDKNRLIKIEQHHGSQIDSTVFEYKLNLLVLKKQFVNSDTPTYITAYNYNPFSETTTQEKDSVIIYQKTKEYDKDFYVKKFYGFSLTPKLKTTVSIIDGKENNLQYIDWNEMLRYEDVKIIENSFDKEGKLLQSKVTSNFMNNRTINYFLKYSYYKNGLLKSIRGYVPLFFKYEYFE